MKRSDRAFYLTMLTLAILLVFFMIYHGKQSMELAEAYKERMQIGTEYAELANRYADKLKEARDLEVRLDNLTEILRNTEAMLITSKERAE